MLNGESGRGQAQLKPHCARDPTEGRSLRKPRLLNTRHSMKCCLPWILSREDSLSKLGAAQHRINGTPPDTACCLFGRMGFRAWTPHPPRRGSVSARCRASPQYAAILRSAAVETEVHIDQSPAPPCRTWSKSRSARHRSDRAIYPARARRIVAPGSSDSCCGGLLWTWHRLRRDWDRATRETARPATPARFPSCAADRSIPHSMWRLLAAGFAPSGCVDGRDGTWKRQSVEKWKRPAGP